MAAIIATEGLGLFNSSKQALGSAGMGFGGAGDQLHVNAVNGNLVVQRQDQIVVGHGVDASVVRTYNSQANFNGNDGDSSRFNFQQKVVQSGNQLTRWTETGSEQTFTLKSGTTDTYISDDIGVDDSITKIGDQWVYRNPENQVSYEFNAQGANLGKLSRMVNGEGLALTYTHTDTSVTITDPAGQSTLITLSAGKVTAIKHIDKDGIVLSSIDYEYTDTNHPEVITSVAVDLTPQNATPQNPADNRYYVTQYTYETRNGNPLLVSVRQGESNNADKTLGNDKGSVVSFVYDSGVDDSNTEPRIAQLIQGEGEKASVTEYVYGDNKTDVITYQRFRVEADAAVPLGQRYIAERTSTTTYHYIERTVENGTNQRMISKVESAANDSGFRAVTVFGYTDQGDVRFVQDAEGNVTRYGYDYDSDSVVASSEGLRLWQMDGEGNAIRWYYNSDSQVISEVRYTDPDLNPSDAIFAASGDEVTRFVYDSGKRLAFSINPAGQVSGTAYSAMNAVDNTRSVTQTLYSTNLLTDTSPEAISAQNAISAVSETIDVALLSTWANNEGGNTQHSISHLDYRGQISQSVTTYTALNLDDNSANSTTSTTHFIYDHRGRLVQQAAPNADSNDSTQATHYVYDGLGRLVATALVENVQDDGSADLINNDTLSIEQATSLPGFNQVTTYTQDTKTGGQHTRTEFANGFIQEQVFDRAGRLVSQHEADGKFTVDSADDIDLGTTEYIYDAQGRLRITQDAEGVLAHSVYNDRNQVVATIDGNGALTELSYDDAGQVTRVIQYANYLTVSQLSRLSANSDDNVRALDVPLESLRPSFSNDDRITHNLYDDANRLIYSIDGEGYVSEIQYDGKGQITNTLKHSTPYPGFTPLNDSDITISRPSLADVGAFAQYNYATAEHFTVDNHTWVQGLHQTTDYNVAIGLSSRKEVGNEIGRSDLTGYNYTYQTVGTTSDALTQSVVSAIDIPSSRTLDFTQSIEALGFYGVASDVIGFEGSTLQYLETSDNQLLLRPVNQVLVGDSSYNSWDEITYHRNQYYAANRDFNFSFKAQDLAGVSDTKHDFVGISDGNGNQWGVRFSGVYTFAATTAHGEMGLHSFGVRSLGSTSQVDLEVKDNVAYLWVYAEGASRPDISQAAQLDLSTWGDFDVLHTTLEMDGTSTQQLAITDWTETGVAIDGPPAATYYHNDFSDEDNNYGFSGYTIGDVDNAAINSDTGIYFNVGAAESFNITQLGELNGANVMRVTTVDSTENVAYRELIGSKRYLLDDSTRTVIRYEFTGGVNSNTFRGFMGITDELGNRIGIKLLRNDVYSSISVRGYDHGQISSNRSTDIGTIYVAEIEMSGGEYHIYYYPKTIEGASTDSSLDNKSQRVLVDHGELPDNMGSRLSSYVQAYGDDSWYYSDKRFYITKMEEWGTEGQWSAQTLEDGNVITEGGLSYNQFFDLDDNTADKYLANLQDIESIKTTLTRLDVEGRAIADTSYQEEVATIFNPDHYDGHLTLLADGTLADGKYQINTEVIYSAESGLASQTYTDVVINGDYQVRTQTAGVAIDGFFNLTDSEHVDYLDIDNTQQIVATVSNYFTGEVVANTVTDLTYKNHYNGYLSLSEAPLADGVYDVVVSVSKLNPETGEVETKEIDASPFTIQQGDRYTYDHELTFDFDAMIAEGVDGVESDAIYGAVDQDSIKLTYWKEDGGIGETQVIEYDPSVTNTSALARKSAATNNAFIATLYNLVEGEYGYRLTYQQENTTEQSSIVGRFVSDPVLSVVNDWQQQNDIFADEHQFTLSGADASDNGRSVGNYLGYISTGDIPLAFSEINLGIEPSDDQANKDSIVQAYKESITLLVATVRYAGTDIVVSTTTTDRTAWPADDKYENILLLTDGTPLTSGEYDVSVTATLADSSVVDLKGFTLQVSDQLDASSTQSQGAQLTWEGINAEQLELRFGQAGTVDGVQPNYTEVLIEQVDGEPLPKVSVFDVKPNTNIPAISNLGASLTGLLGQYSVLSIAGLTTNPTSTSVTGVVNAGLEDSITQAYAQQPVNVTHTGTLNASHQASHTLEWEQFSRTVDFADLSELGSDALTANHGFVINDSIDGIDSETANKRVITDDNGIRLIHNDPDQPDNWVNVSGSLNYDNSLPTATKAKQTQMTYHFNSGRLDYSGFLGMEGTSSSNTTTYLGLYIQDNKAYSTTQSLSAGSQLMNLDANTDYVVTVTLKGTYASIELHKAGDETVNASYSDPTATSLLTSHSYMAVKGDGGQFGNSLLINSLMESGEHTDSTVVLEYRREGQTEWQNASVAQSDGKYSVSLGSQAIDGDRVDQWEYRVSEQQNGATLRQFSDVLESIAAVAGGVNIVQANSVTATVKTQQLSQSQGTSIQGFLTSTQQQNLDYAVTTITNSDGELVDTVTTWASLDKNYTGYLNISADNRLAEGLYSLSVDLVEDGAVTETLNAEYQRNNQHTVTQLITWAVDGDAINAAHELALHIRPKGSEEEYQKLLVTELNGQYQSTIVGAPNSEWEFVILEKHSEQETIMSARKGNVTLGEITGTVLEQYVAIGETTSSDNPNVTRIHATVVGDAGTFDVDTNVSSIAGYAGQVYLSNGEALADGNYTVTLSYYDESDALIRTGAPVVYQVGDDRSLVGSSVVNENTSLVTVQDIGTHYIVQYLDPASNATNTIEIAKGLDENTLTIEELNDSQYAYGIAYKDAQGQLYSQLDGSFIAEQVGTPTADELGWFYGQSVEVDVVAGVEVGAADISGGYVSSTVTVTKDNRIPENISFKNGTPVLSVSDLNGDLGFEYVDTFIPSGYWNGLGYSTRSYFVFKEGEALPDLNKPDWFSDGMDQSEMEFKAFIWADVEVDTPGYAGAYIEKKTMDGEWGFNRRKGLYGHQLNLPIDPASSGTYDLYYASHFVRTDEEGTEHVALTDFGGLQKIDSGSFQLGDSVEFEITLKDMPDEVMSFDFVVLDEEGNDLVANMYSVGDLEEDGSIQITVDGMTEFPTKYGLQYRIDYRNESEIVGGTGIQTIVSNISDDFDTLAYQASESNSSLIYPASENNIYAVLDVMPNRIYKTTNNAETIIAASVDVIADNRVPDNLYFKDGKPVIDVPDFNGDAGFEYAAHFWTSQWNEGPAYSTRSYFLYESNEIIQNTQRSNIDLLGYQPGAYVDYWKTTEGYIGAYAERREDTNSGAWSKNLDTGVQGHSIDLQGDWSKAVSMFSSDLNSEINGINPGSYSLYYATHRIHTDIKDTHHTYVTDFSGLQKIDSISFQEGSIKLADSVAFEIVLPDLPADITTFDVVLVGEGGDDLMSESHVVGELDNDKSSVSLMFNGITSLPSVSGLKYRLDFYKESKFVGTTSTQTITAEMNGNYIDWKTSPKELNYKLSTVSNIALDMYSDELSESESGSIVKLPNKILTKYELSTLDSVEVDIFSFDEIYAGKTVGEWFNSSSLSQLESALNPENSRNVVTNVSEIQNWSGSVNFRSDTSEALPEGHYLVRFTLVDKNGSELFEYRMVPYTVGAVGVPATTPTLTWNAGNVPASTDVWIRYKAATDLDYAVDNNGWKNVDVKLGANGQFNVSLTGLSLETTKISENQTTGLHDFEILYVDSLTHKEISGATGSFDIAYNSDTPTVLDIQFTRDINGREARTFYDVNGQIQATLSADGAVTEFIYNGFNQLIDTVRYSALVSESLRANGSLTDVLENSQASSDTTLHNVSLYNERGSVVATINAEGIVTLFEYNQNKQQVATKVLQRQLTDSYLKDVVFANPALMTVDKLLSYTSTDDNGALIFKPAATGASVDQLTQVNYTLRGEVNQTTAVDDTISQFNYDNMGRVVSTIVNYDNAVSNSRTASQGYDVKGRVTSETNGDQVVTHAYDLNGLRISTTTASADESINNNARTTRFFYDANGRLTFSLNNNDELAETLYNSFGEVIGSQTYAAHIRSDVIDTSLLQGGITSALLLQYFRSFRTESDNRNHIRYDRRGSVRLLADALGNQQRFEYNAFSERTRTIRDAKGGDLDGQTIINETFYDKRGRVVSTSDDALGVRRNASIVYDAFGRITDQFDGNNNHLNIELDKVGRQTQVLQFNKDGDILSQRDTTYDALGRVLTLQDGVGTTQYIYDDVNRNVAIKINTGTDTLTETTISNRFGETRLVEQANGDRTIYDYNDQGQLTAVYNNTEALRDLASFSESTIQGYIDAVNADAKQQADSVNEYYQSGLLKISEDVKGTKVHFTYDAAQRLIRKTVDYTEEGASNHVGLNLVTDYQYDAQGRQVSDIQWLGTPGEVTEANPNNAIITTTEYDVAGRVSHITVKGTIPDNDMDLEGKNDVVTSFTYDDLGNRLTVSTGGVPNVQYDTDDNDNLVRIYSAPLSSTRYEYDTLGRRVAEIVDSSFTDDETGQTLYQGLDLTTRYQYDANNNVVVSIAANDARTLFYYDAADREIFRVSAEGDVSETIYNAQHQVVGVRQYAAPINTYLLAGGANSDEVMARLGLGEGAGGSAVSQADIMADHPTSQRVYDDAGRLIYTIDALGLISKNIYDPVDRVVQTVQYAIDTGLENQLIADTHNGNDAVTLVDNAIFDAQAPVGSSHEQQTMYDVLGRAWIQVNALGQVTESQYDRAGRLVLQVQYDDALSDYTGGATEASIEAFIKAQRIDDIASQIRAEVQNTGEITTNRYTWFTYDALGRQKTQLNSLGYMSESEYDAAGRMVHSRRYTVHHALELLFAGDALNPNNEPLNNLSSSAFNTNLVKITDALNSMSLVELEEATLASATLKLNVWSSDLQKTVQDWYLAVDNISKGNVSTTNTNFVNSLRQTSTEYDNAGRVIAVIDEEANSKSNHPTDRERYEYDAAGNRTALINKKGDTWVSVYDAANRLIQKITPEVAQTELVGVLSTENFADGNGDLVVDGALTAIPNTSGDGLRLQNTDAIAATAEMVLNDASDNIWETTLSFSGDVLATNPVIYYAGANDLGGNRGVELELSETTIKVTHVFGNSEITSTLKDASDNELVLDKSKTYVFRFHLARAYSGEETSTLTATVYTVNGSTRNEVGSVSVQTDWDVDQSINVKSTASTGIRLAVAGESDQAIILHQMDNLVDDVRWAEWAETTRSVDTQQPVITEYEYDSLGNVTRMVEGKGTLGERVTGFVYDDLGRQTTTIHPTVGIYDEVSDTRATQDYSNEARLQVTRTPTETTYFDSLGNETAHLDTRGVDTFKVYDTGNRLAYEVDGEHYVTGYTYDAFNNVETLTRYANALNIDAVDMLRVPTNGRFGMTLSALEAQLSVDGVNDRTITNSYDALNRQTTVVQGSVAMLANGMDNGLSDLSTVSGTDYDDFGQIVREWRLDGNNAAVSTFHLYDQAGRRIATLDSENYLTSVSYDSEGNQTGRTEYANQYDGSVADFVAGDFSKQSLTTASAAEIDAVNDVLNSAIGYDREYHYTYDVLNRRTSEAQRHTFVDQVEFTDPMNNAVSSELTRTYAEEVLLSETTYDVLGNVVELSTTKDGTVDTKLTTQTFYDVLGRVTAIVEPGMISSTQDSSEQLVITHIDKGKGSAELRWRSPQLAGIDAGNVEFQYRVVGESIWSKSIATVNAVTTSVAVGGLDTNRYEYRVNYFRMGDEERYGVSRGEIDIITGNMNSPDNTTSWVEQSDGHVEIHVVTPVTGENLRLTINGSEVPDILLDSTGSYHIYTVTSAAADMLARGGYQFVVEDITTNEVLTQGNYQITQANDVTQASFSLLNSNYSVDSDVKSQMWYDHKKDKWRHNNSFSVDWSSTQQLGGGDVSWSITIETSNAHGDRHTKTITSEQVNVGGGFGWVVPGGITGTVSAPGHGNGRVTYTQKGLSFTNTHDKTSKGRSAKIEGVIGVTVWKQVGNTKLKVIDTQRENANSSGSGDASVNRIELLNVNLPENPQSLTLRYRVPQSALEDSIETQDGVIINRYQPLWKEVEVERVADGLYWGGRDGIPAGIYQFQLFDGANNVTSDAVGSALTLIPSELGEAADSAMMTIGDGVDSQSQIDAGTGQIVSPLTAFAYDAVGNRLQETRYSGGANREMLANGDVVGNTDVNKDQISRWRYDQAGNMTQHINGEQNNTFFAYDEAGKLRKEWLTTTTTDEFGQLRRQVQGQVFRYDNVGQQTHAVELRPQMDEEFRQLSGDKLLGTAVDEQQLSVTEMRYNSFGEMIAKGHVNSAYLGNDAEAPVTEASLQEYFQYNNLGQLIQTNQDTGVDRAYYYDRLGNMVQEISDSGMLYQDGAATDTDIGGLSYAQTFATADNLLRKTRYEYDSMGRTTHVAYPAFISGDPLTPVTFNPTTDQTYDRWGNVLTSTDAAENTTLYHYNDQNKVIYEQKLVGDTIAGWQQVGDETDNKLQKLDALTIDTHYYLDRQGRTIGTVDANNHRKATGFNNKGLAAKQVAADGGVLHNGYDALGQRREATNALGHSHYYRYDQAGQMTNHYTASGGETAYAYDEAGNQVEMKQLILSIDNGETNTWQTTKNTFDGLGNVVRTVVGDAEAGIGEVSKTKFYFDEQGNKAGSWLLGGGYSRTTNDYFGRKKEMVDLGGITTYFDYDQAGQLRHQYQTDDRFFVGANNVYKYEVEKQDIRFDYLINGQMKTRNDIGTNLETSFEYDVLGRQTNETFTGKIYELGAYEDTVTRFGMAWVANEVGKYEYAKTSYTFTETNYRDVKNDAIGNTRTYYDDLGRVTNVVSTSAGMDQYGINVQYEYDAMGNRIRVYEAGKEDDADTALWYSYDKMDRLRVAKGSAVDDGEGVYTLGKNTSQDDSSIITYDLAGNRITAERNNSTEFYQYDADNRHVATQAGDAGTGANQQFVNQKYYDRMGRAVYQLNYYYNPNDAEPEQGSARELMAYEYYSNGKMATQASHDPNGLEGSLWEHVSAKGEIEGLSNAKYTVEMKYTHFGELQQQVTNSGGNTDTINHYYGAFDSHKLIRKEASRSAAGYLPGTLSQYYDANGNVVNIRDHKENKNDRDLFLNGQGQIVRKRYSHTGNEADLGKIQYYYYSNGKGVATKGEEAPTDLDYNFTPINESYPSPTPGTYVVQQDGETLNNVALMMWGDASLWYLIADANGFGAAASLTAGQTLIIPNQVTNIHNTSETFKPYSATEIIGDTTPTMPLAPPPKESGGGCGVAQILVIIVVIVASIFTAGAALAGLGALGVTTGVTVGAGASGLFAAGLAVGSASLGSAIVAGFVAGAVGSIVGQLTGMALGIQDEFSWGDVGVGAVTGAFTAGLSTSQALAGVAAGTKETLSASQIAMNSAKYLVRSAATYAVDYAANKAAGNEVSFSWGNVAASAVAASIVKNGIGNSTTSGVGGLIQSTAVGTAQGLLTREIKRTLGIGGKQSGEMILANAFGQAIGNSIVGPGLSDGKNRDGIFGAEKSSGLLGHIFDGRGAVQSQENIVASTPVVPGKNSTNSNSPAHTGFQKSTSPLSGFNERMQSMEDFGRSMEGVFGSSDLDYTYKFGGTLDETIARTRFDFEYKSSRSENRKSDKWQKAGDQSRALPSENDGSSFGVLRSDVNEVDLYGLGYEGGNPKDGPTGVGDFGAIYGSASIINEVLARDKIVKVLSKTTGIAARYADKISVASKFTLNGFDGLAAVDKTMKTPGTQTSKIVGSAQPQLSALKTAGNIVNGVYVVSTAGKELLDSQEQGLSARETELNVATRVVGSGSEIAIGHAAAHTVGLGAAVFTAPLGGGVASWITGPVGYGVGYAATTIAYQFADVFSYNGDNVTLGTLVNNMTTDGYRELTTLFPEAKTPTTRGQMGRNR
ncbi:hypothetical protein A9Q99_15555 [Gammaproteobacteria bacterium 45_16_T64]|nr:hypothetical protein A9Q99_15555 [Gammaproteobacteria bacterium 45_16_T64]